MNAGRFNRALARATGKADRHLPAMTRAYAAALRATGRRCSLAFEQHVHALVAAGEGEPPKFVPPDVDEVLDVEAMAADVAKRTRAIRTAAVDDVAGGTLRSVGIAFDVGGVMAQRLITSAGVRVTAEMGQGARATVQGVIEKAVNEGWTVPDTAKEIRASFNGLAGYQATALARTDLIGVTNGGSMIAARSAWPEGDVFKTWLATADDRTRPSHEDADGQTVPINQPFDVGGDALDFPGDPEGSDEEVIQCRCTVTYDDNPDPSSLVAAAVDFSSGTMIAVYPLPEEAAALAVEGGQPADDLHCTLAFLPDGVEGAQTAGLVTALGKIASRFDGPLTGSCSGVGVFQAGDDGTPVLGLPSVVGLADLRVAVCEALDQLRIPYATNYGWVPHITLAYADEQDPDLPIDRVGQALTFQAVTLQRGTDRTDVELGRTTLTAGGTDVKLKTQTDGRMAIRDGRTSLQTEDETTGPSWESTLCVEGVPTEDKRLLEVGSISWRQLPLTLMAMTENPEFGGHAGAEVAGRIDTIQKPSTDVLSTGVFDTGEFGMEVARLVDERIMRGVSVDLAVLDYELRNEETGEVLEGDELMDAFFNDVPILFVVLDGVILGATVCPMQAIEEAQIAVVASGLMTMKFWYPFPPSGITASAAGLAPTAPPAEWFSMPEPDEPTPLTVTDDGHVFGHAALWGTCHIGEPLGGGVCAEPPASPSGYAHFHLGEVVCSDGSRVNVGALTMDTGHAPLGVTGQAAAAHYDDTGTVAAHVRATDGKFGIWLTGALNPRLDADDVRILRGARVSGDWRTFDRALELVAALAVNLGGYPVPRPEAVVAAGDERVALVAAGMVPTDLPPTDAQLAKVKTLTARARGGAEALVKLARS